MPLAPLTLVSDAPAGNPAGAREGGSYWTWTTGGGPLYSIRPPARSLRTGDGPRSQMLALIDDFDIPHRVRRGPCRSALLDLRNGIADVIAAMPDNPRRARFNRLRLDVNQARQSLPSNADWIRRTSGADACDALFDGVDWIDRDSD